VSTLVISPLRLKAFFGEQGAAVAGFGFAALGQVDIHPSGEAIFQIPLALAVTGEHQAGHARISKAVGTSRGVDNRGTAVETCGNCGTGLAAYASSHLHKVRDGR
jgi:hypothetical protein